MPETPQVIFAALNKLQAQQYRHLQAAARLELSQRGRQAGEGAGLSEDIDPFAVLTREQIEKLLADFETKDQRPEGGA